MKETMKDDFVKIGKREFKFGTIPYWLIRFGQGVLAFAWGYVAYIGICLIFGEF